MRLLLIGPPGAGKGTQARRIADRLGAAHIASGDVLREAIAAGTDLGRRAQTFMDRGDLVPDDVVIALITERLQGDDMKCFVLDGFPRTTSQALALDTALEEADRPLDLVVHLDVPDDEIVQRLSGRRTCPSCQRAYHMTYDPPADDERCDDDATPLETRSDDAPETVRHRLGVYNTATAGLLEHYAELLETVEGTGSVEDVGDRIDQAIEQAS